MGSPDTVESFPTGARLICLDIGGTAIRGGVATIAAGAVPQIGLRRRDLTHAAQGGAAVLRRAVQMVSAVLAEVPEAIGVAVSSAGVIDDATGQVVSATELIPGWTGVELGAALRRETGLRCTVLNDVHAHALGEVRVGAGEGCSSALVVAVGTGVGGALIHQGAPVRGAGGLAGHVGHMHHSAARQVVCSCGRTGHLESVASGSGIASRYAARRLPSDPEAADAAEVAAVAADVEGTARRTLITAGTALGECLGSLANAWDPERIILTGSVTGAGGLWWHAVRRGYAATAMDPLRHRALFRGALGDDAPLLGAATMHEMAIRSETTSNRRST
ncbi:ROK family protein [Nesterenkonia sp. K-15-9-6]|uniref:ROK family protein n=1 Tax=Nesterenkonia sp. K-15-9-6 TaxID=3093918 RepID=UPI00404511DF